MIDVLHVRTSISHAEDDHEVTCLNVAIWPLPNNLELHGAIKTAIELLLADMFGTQPPIQLPKGH